MGATSLIIRCGRRTLTWSPCVFGGTGSHFASLVGRSVGVARLCAICPALLCGDGFRSCRLRLDSRGDAALAQALRMG